MSARFDAPPAEAAWISSDDLAVFESQGTTAHRICSADDYWIERFNKTALISVKDRALSDELIVRLDKWLEQTGFEINRIYARYLVRQPRMKDHPILLRGDDGQSPQEIVQESGLSYEVDFATGYSVGLFCDQRANRVYLRSLSPKRVLNTFAYTCAFSVAAAHVGAETLSIDLSKSSLARGQENFVLNDLPTEKHRFLADDVLDVLPRLARREEKFDAIILDPPTFSRSSPKRSFRAERDFGELIESALACAAPGASLLLSTNCTALDVAALRKIASRVSRGKAKFHTEPPLPDIPARHSASTLWMKRT